MSYALLNIERTAILKTGPRPNWKVDGGPASDELLRHGGFETETIDGKEVLVLDESGNRILATGRPGWYPIHHDRPEHDPHLQRAVQKPKSEWLIEAERVVATYDVVDIDIEELRQSKLQATTDMRWAVMTGGLTLPGDIEVGTTIDDQNRITSVVANAALAGLTDADEVDFKAASGWVQISIGQIKAIAGAIGQHVQACYSAERTHHDAIDALTTREQIRDYDISVGWPEPETEPT